MESILIKKIILILLDKMQTTAGSLAKCQKYCFKRCLLVKKLRESGAIIGKLI
jgi:Asp-tRNA(Asn)/Glu-tRNA(Gln) amidotransferase A subunit family amidase